MVFLFLCIQCKDNSPKVITINAINHWEALKQGSQIREHHHKNRVLFADFRCNKALFNPFDALFYSYVQDPCCRASPPSLQKWMKKRIFYTFASLALFYITLLYFLKFEDSFWVFNILSIQLSFKLTKYY